MAQRKRRTSRTRTRIVMSTERKIPVGTLVEFTHDGHLGIVIDNESEYVYLDSDVPIPMPYEIFWFQSSISYHYKADELKENYFRFLTRQS